MILGAAQVVVNVASLRRAERALGDYGYRRTFAEPHLNCDPAKRPLLSRDRPTLALAHYAAPTGGTPVELTMYGGGPPGGDAAFQLLRPRLDLERALPHCKGQGARVEAPAEVQLASDGGDEEVRFWSEVGFAPTGSSSDPVGFRLRGVVANMRVGLRLDAAASPVTQPTLDAHGCVALTLVTTTIDADCRRSVAAGAAREVCGPWHERVGGRELRVAMLQAPSGAIVELIQLPRSQGSLAPR